MRYATVAVLLAATLLAAAAHAVQREVLVQDADIRDTPAGSISFTGDNISNVEIETGDDDDGVLIWLNYDAFGGDGGGVLNLPGAVGRYTQFELPAGTEPVIVDPATGATGPLLGDSGPGPIGLPDNGFGLFVGGGLFDYETAPVRNPAVQVSPEEGTPSLRSDDSVDLDNLQFGLDIPLGSRLGLGLTYMDYDGDETSRASFEPGSGVTWGFLLPFDDNGLTGAVAGDVGVSSRNAFSIDGRKLGATIRWPFDRDLGAWRLRPFAGVGYYDHDLEYEQLDGFPGLEGVSVTQMVDVDVESWDLFIGGDLVRPLNERINFRLTAGLMYQDFEADARIRQSVDVFGDVTERGADSSTSDSNVAFMAGAGLNFRLGGGLSADLSYTYLGSNAFAEVQNTTNGDAILEGERFDVDTDTGSLHGASLVLAYRFGGF